MVAIIKTEPRHTKPLWETVQSRSNAMFFNTCFKQIYAKGVQSRQHFVTGEGGEAQMNQVHVQVIHNKK